jgi:hypothetical protein
LCCWIIHNYVLLSLCIVRYNYITFISILSRHNDLPGRGEKAKNISQDYHIYVTCIWVSHKHRCAT